MNLNDLLHEASEALSSTTSAAAPSNPSQRGRGRPIAIAGLGVVLALVVGLAAFGILSTSDDPDTVGVTADQGTGDDVESEPIVAATTPAPGASPTTIASEPATAAEPAEDDGAVPDGAWVSDGVPDDLALQRSVSASELGEPTARLATQVYGVDGRAPLEDDQRLTISWSAGESAPPLFGDPIPLRGGEGVQRGDGAVGFSEGAFNVWVNSATLTDAERLAVAEQIEVGPDGPAPLAAAPGGLTLLGTITSLLFDDMGSSVPPDGFSTDYTAGQRSASVMSGAAGSNDATMILWASAVVQEQIGDRTVAVAFAEPLAQGSWVEDGRLVRVLTSGLSRAEFDAVVAGARAAGSGDRVSGVSAAPSVAVEAGATGDTATLDGAERVVASAVPADLTIRASGAHDGLGPAMFETTRQVYGPSAGGASITIAVGPSSPPFPGEVVQVAGVDVTIVDKVASNGASADLMMTIDHQSVTIQGAGVTIDTMLAAAEAYIAAGDLASLTELGGGFVVRGAERLGVWQVGDVVLNGPVAGASILYNDGAQFGRSLQVTSAPVAESGDVGWYVWLRPDETEVIDLAGIAAEFVHPGGDWTVVRFLSGDRIVELRAHQLTDDEVLDAASTLRAATDDEWDIG